MSFVELGPDLLRLLAKVLASSTTARPLAAVSSIVRFALPNDVLRSIEQVAMAHFVTGPHAVWHLAAMTLELHFFSAIHQLNAYLITIDFNITWGGRVHGPPSWQGTVAELLAGGFQVNLTPWQLARRLRLRSHPSPWAMDLQDLFDVYRAHGDVHLLDQIQLSVYAQRSVHSPRVQLIGSYLDVEDLNEIFAGGEDLADPETRIHFGHSREPSTASTHPLLPLSFPPAHHPDHPDGDHFHLRPELQTSTGEVFLFFWKHMPVAGVNSVEEASLSQEELLLLFDVLLKPLW